MANSNEYMRVYMLNRYHERRAEAVKLLGGKCVECDSVDNLEIDHIDPSTKTMDISKLWSVSREKYLTELNLCQLLCKLHHIEKTSKEQSVGHGEGSSGKKNCKCELCKQRKRQYMQEYMKTYVRKR